MKDAGFTLIELLVAVAIIMVVTGGVIVNYNSYNDAQKVRQDTLTVKSNLRRAQSGATSGEKPKQGCSQLEGYQVSFTAATYAIQAACTEGLVGAVQEFSLGSGHTFSPVPSDTRFRVLSRGVDSDVTIVVTGSNRSYQFTVSRSGDMSDVIQVP